MKISSNEQYMYIECSIEEIYSPAFQRRKETINSELKLINSLESYKGKPGIITYDIGKGKKNIKEIRMNLTFSDEKDLISTIEAKNKISKKIQTACENLSKISLDIAKEFEIVRPVFQFECSAEKYSTQNEKEEIKKIRPIMRYIIEENFIRAELRQKFNENINPYSSHIQFVNALKNVFNKPVKFRSEVKGDKAIEIFTDTGELQNKVKISATNENINIKSLNYEFELLNSCSSKLDKNLEFSISSGISRIELETKDFATKVTLEDNNEPYNDFGISYLVIDPDMLNRDVTVKYTGNIRMKAGDIEKNINETLMYNSKKDFVAPLKIYFKEEKKDLPKVRKSINKNNLSKQEFTKEVQQRLL